LGGEFSILVRSNSHPIVSQLRGIVGDLDTWPFQDAWWGSYNGIYSILLMVSEYDADLRDKELSIVIILCDTRLLVLL